jgi:hypothetical protein
VSPLEYLKNKTVISPIPSENPFNLRRYLDETKLLPETFLTVYETCE